MGASFTRLSQLLQADRDPETVVAWRHGLRSGGEQPQRWGELCRAVAALASRVREAPEGAWILACDDRLGFAIGLLALWQSGRRAIAPPNTQPASLESLAGRAVGLISDREGLLRQLPLLSPLEQPAPQGNDGWRCAPLDPAAEVLELSTSGTTGAGKPTLKRLTHLEEEVDHLEAQWGIELDGARIFCTASHQHLYGLLFGLLWPLCSGRPFQVEGLLHAGELFPRMRASGRAALASVPSHLRRMVEHEDVPGLRDRCHVTFSSGGPLAGDTADRWSAAVGAPPIEIFGSTETGGVAWRCQRPGPDRLMWQAFAPVQVERAEPSGCLRVRSPFVSDGDGAEGFTMGDRVRLQEGGRFLLEGRADRVVKVGEKRLSLPSMEAHLREHPLVAEAALVLLGQSGEARVGAVVVPSEAGAALLDAEGRRALSTALSAHLGERWDRVLLPRAWRALPQMVEDAQGKVTAGALQALFAESELVASGRPRYPEVLEESREADACEQLCRVPEDLAQLEGHFPGQPVVPGVAEVDWAVRLSATWLGVAPEVRGLEALKFPTLLLPGMRFRMRVDQRGPESLGFRLWWEEEEFASGRLLIAAEQRP